MGAALNSLYRFKHVSCLGLLAVVQILAMTVFAPLAVGDEDESTPSTSVGTTPASPALLGPKRSLAVGKFDSIGSFSQQYGDWDIGGGLAAMLTTSLEKSGQFIVLDRAYTQQLMNEQALKKGGMLNQETAPKTGQMLGAQYLIYGAVTEFGTQDKGGGVSFGFGGNLPLGLGHSSTGGAVAFDLRIVDTSTGQVVQTATEREEINSSNWSLSTGYKGMQLGGNEFMSTPLGAATRKAIDHAVADIISVAAKRPWQGQVVEMEGKEVVINAGSNAGVKIGDHFYIEHPLKQLTDPTTGEVLSERRQRLGSLEVDSVEEKISTGAYVSVGPAMPSRGDVVIQITK